MMKSFLTLASIVFLISCASKPKDYTQFKAEKPKSILVLPPLNQSTEVHASYSFLSTVSRPIAEQGYYVFPVAVVDKLMKLNGLPGPGEMHQASLSKIKEIINPDAVLYITLHRYGTKFHIVDSNSTVEASAKLVSTKSRKVLWEGKGIANHSAAAANQNQGLLGMVINAAVAQAVNDSLDKSREVSRYAANAMLLPEGQGLLEGPYLEKSKQAK